MYLVVGQGCSGFRFLAEAGNWTVPFPAGLLTGKSDVALNCESMLMVLTKINFSNQHIFGSLEAMLMLLLFSGKFAVYFFYNNQSYQEMVQPSLRVRYSCSAGTCDLWWDRAVTNKAIGDTIPYQYIFSNRRFHFHWKPAEHL